MMLKIDTIILWAYLKSIYTFCGIQNFINSKPDNPIDFLYICFFSLFSLFFRFPSCDLIPPMLLLLRCFLLFLWNTLYHVELAKK